jgi:hypothetical protein
MPPAAKAKVSFCRRLVQCLSQISLGTNTSSSYSEGDLLLTPIVD